MDEEKPEMFNDAGTRLEEGAIAAQAPAYKPGARAPLSKKAFWRILISLELCMLAIALDFYGIPVAVPSLSFRGFGYNNSAWLGTAFLASFPIGLLVWPSLCKGFGYKFSFVVAIEAFNVASTYAATSKTAERLIAFRLVAGAGAGGACGLFDTILRDILPPKEVGKYMIASWAIWAVTAVVSPLMAGALAEYVYPTFCFNIHFIPGQIGYLMAFFFLNLPEPFWSQTRSNFSNFDYVGTLCLMVGTALMLIATSSDGTLFADVADHMFMFSFFGLTLLTAFLLNQRLVPDPLLPSKYLIQPHSGGPGIDFTCLANAHSSRASQLIHRCERPVVKQTPGGTYLGTNDDYNDYLRVTVGIRDVLRYEMKWYHERKTSVSK